MDTDNPLIEASDEGKSWLIRVIRAGTSKNGNHYSPETLRQAAPLFEGARVFVKGDDEHIKGQGRNFSQLIGGLSSPEFVTDNGGEIRATLNILQSAGDSAAKLLEAFQRGMTNLFGFSIDAEGKTEVKRVGMARRKVRDVQSISSVRSVDLIVQPSAGGEIINLIESIQDDRNADMTLRETMIEKVKAVDPTLLDGLDDKADDYDAKLMEAYTKAMAPKPNPKPKPDPDPDPAKDFNAMVQAKLTEAMSAVDSRVHLIEALAECNLPDKAKQKIREGFDGKTFEAKDVDAAIESERTYLAELTESGRITGLGENSVQAGEDQADKHSKMLDALLDPNDRSVFSLKECYIQMTGDKRITGRIRESTRITEAVNTGGFPQALGDSITRRMIEDYNHRNQYTVWRPIVSVVPVSDFRVNRRVRFGGYGNLPAVAESGSYDPLTTPNDEEATYAASKRGGTEVVTLEAIRNDDVGLVQRVPTAMARAAQRTLGAFVFDFLDGNANIYDGNPLFHATHNNLGTAALDEASFAAGRLAMRQQDEMDSAQRLGIMPEYMVIPLDLEQTAYDLFRRDTNNDPSFIQTVSPMVIPVWYWTDANNWYLSANPADCPTIEIGFLDGNEEPEIFIQDSPSVGSFFSNDQITYKIRHIYGGAVVDYRGLYGAVVP